MEIERVEIFGVEMPLVGALQARRVRRASVSLLATQPSEIRFEKELIGHPTEDFHQFSGLSRIRELESKYLSAEEVRHKYG